jgi:signal transduction histidine kinase
MKKTAGVRRRATSKSAFYADLSHLLSTSTDLRILIEQVSELFSSQLDVDYVSMLVFSDQDHMVSGGTAGYPKVPRADARAINLYMGAGRVTTSVHKLGSEDRLRRLMVSHHMSLVVPLYRRDSLLGYIFVGPTVYERYSKRHVDLLDSVADEISVAVQNAVSIHAVRELNATLQQRIAEATKELQASNAQLQRLDAAKDEFVSMASHQLRTPLTSVKGYISMVLEGDAGEVTDMQKQLLEQAFSSSERMVRLIGDFLNVSRLQTGKFVIDTHLVDLAKVVAQELDGLKTSAVSRGLTFSYTPPLHFPTISLDEDKIRQVIMNFCDNALYYSKEGSSIDVTLTAQKDSVTFRVKDNGIGVPKSEQEGLFTKFFRASNAKKQRPDGTGVGLFLAKKVVDAHGGTLIFQSGEGKGSTFGFTLPIASLAARKDAN